MGRDGGGGWYVYVTKQGGFVTCQEMPRHFLERDDTLMTPNQTAFQAHSSGYG